METLVLRHQAEVARLLWRFAPTHADLEDLVQETFLRVLRGLARWQPERPFLHWLRRITVNTARDYCRKQTVRRRWQIEPAATAMAENADPVLEARDVAPDPAARAAANEVKQFLATLPPDDRTLLTLQHLEGWALAEIAAHFGWTVTATKLRGFRARHRLRAALEEKHSP